MRNEGSVHRRRMELEDKAKFAASVWLAEFVQFVAALSAFILISIHFVLGSESFLEYKKKLWFSKADLIKSNFLLITHFIACTIFIKASIWICIKIGG